MSGREFSSSFQSFRSARNSGTDWSRLYNSRKNRRLAFRVAWVGLVRMLSSIPVSVFQEADELIHLVRCNLLFQTGRHERDTRTTQLVDFAAQNSMFFTTRFGDDDLRGGFFSDDSGKNAAIFE